MNASKVISLLSRAAVVSGAAALAGFLFNFHAVELFSVAVGLFSVLFVAADYAPRSAYGFTPTATGTPGVKLGHRLPLAA